MSKLNPKKYFLFIIFIIVIIYKSNSFTVADYNGAVESLSHLDKYTYFQLMNLKKTTAIIEVTYDDQTKQIVDGFASSDSVFIFRKFLTKQYIKEIKYEYDGKEIVMRGITTIQGIHYYELIGIKGNTKDENLIKFAINSYAFKNLLQICCGGFSSTGSKIELQKYFPIEDYGDVFAHYFGVFSINNILFSINLIKDISSWFIIGKVNDSEGNQIIPLQYVTKKITLNSLRSADAKISSLYLFMHIKDSIKFSDKDVGAYLVHCSLLLQKYTCKFFGQIEKVLSTSSSSNTLFVELLYYQIIQNTQFAFQSSSDSPVIETPKAETLIKKAQTSSKGNQTFNPESGSKQAIKRPHDDSNTDSKEKKQRPDFSQDSGRYDKKLSCNSINEIGIHDFGDNRYIVVSEADTNYLMVSLSDRYQIIGNYIIDKKPHGFDICKDTATGIDLFKIIDGQDKLIVQLSLRITLI